MSSHLAVILNPSSGANNNEDLQNRLAKSFSTARDSEVWILLAGKGGDIVKLAKHAVAEGADPIVAGGGNGTLNAVASVLVGTERTLGVLPLGTLNHFAKDLNIPLDVEGAVRTLIEGTVAQVDVGEVNGRIFLNNSGLGLYPHIVRHREKLQDRLGHGKWPAFLWAVLSVLRRYPFLAVRMSTDEQAFVRRTPLYYRICPGALRVLIPRSAESVQNAG